MSSLSFSTLPSLPTLRSLRAHPARMLFPAVLLSLAAGSVFAAGESGARTQSERASCDAPVYPARWQIDGDSGTATLAVLVGEDGKVKESRLVSSSGNARIDRASLKASARCNFEPASRDKGSVPAWTQVRYTWVVE